MAMPPIVAGSLAAVALLAPRRAEVVSMPEDVQKNESHPRSLRTMRVVRSRPASGASSASVVLSMPPSVVPPEIVPSEGTLRDESLPQAPFLANGGAGSADDLANDRNEGLGLAMVRESVDTAVLRPLPTRREVVSEARGDAVGELPESSAGAVARRDRGFLDRIVRSFWRRDTAASVVETGASASSELADDGAVTQTTSAVLDVTAVAAVTESVPRRVRPAAVPADEAPPGSGEGDLASDDRLAGAADVDDEVAERPGIVAADEAVCDVDAVVVPDQALDGTALIIDRVAVFLSKFRFRKRSDDVLSLISADDAVRMVDNVLTEDVVAEPVADEEAVVLSDERIAAADERLAEIANSPVFEAPVVPVTLSPAWAADYAAIGMDVSIEGRERLIARFGLLDESDIVESLSRVFLTEDAARVRALALTIVGERKLTSLLDAAKHAGRSSDPYERCAAVIAVAGCGDFDSVVGFFDDVDAGVVRTAVAHVIDVLDPETVRGKVNDLNGPHRQLAIDTFELLSAS